LLPVTPKWKAERLRRPEPRRGPLSPGPVTPTADDRAIVAAWAVLREKSRILRGGEFSDEEFDRICVELERLQTIITRTPATTAAVFAIKLRCVLEAMVDERSAHEAVLNGGMAGAEHVLKAEITEQMLWSLLEQVEAGAEHAA
jgi:hypothetical protein